MAVQTAIRAFAFLLAAGLLAISFRSNSGILSTVNLPSLASNIVNEKWDFRNVSMPEEISFKFKEVRLLHIGKAGGGSVRERFKQWNLNISQCHPKPCNPKKASNIPKATILLIRDPIDRFVSAFFWRMYILCDPHGDERKHKKTMSDPTHQCKKRKEEAKGIIDTFHGNASLLAETLCSSNAEEAKKAKLVLKKINHANFALTAWLKFKWQPENLFSIVLEHGAASLDVQTDEAVEWIYTKLSFENFESFYNRTEFVKHLSTTGAHRHSSPGGKHELTSQAERCLGKFHKKDYNFLKNQKENLCRTSDCLEGIQSILDRRRVLFDDEA